MINLFMSEKTLECDAIWAGFVVCLSTETKCWKRHIRKVCKEGLLGQAGETTPGFWPQALPC